MSKYLDLISLSKDAKETAALQEAAEDAAIQLDADIQAASKAKREADKALAAAKSAIPLDSNRVIIASRAVANADEDIAALKALKEELF